MSASQCTDRFVQRKDPQCCGLRAERMLTFTQMPHPMHSSSDIHATFEAGVTSMHSLPAYRSATSETDN